MKTLKNVTIRVVVHELMPYTHLENNRSQVFLTGFIGEVWNILETFLEFRSEYSKTSFENGKEILKKGGADVMLTPIVFESDNIVDFDSPGPITTSVYSLYMMDSDDSGNSSSYLTTWSSELWAAYFLLLCVFTVVLWVMRNVRYKMKLDKSLTSKESNHTDKQTNEETFWDSMFVICGAATQQDTTIVSKVSSLRLLQVSLLLFTSLMTTSYNSVLVSRLTVAQNSYHISLESIPRPGVPFLCVRSNSAVFSMFQANGSQELQERWANVVNKGVCLPKSKTTSDVASNLCLRGAVVFESSNIMSRLLARGVGCQMVRLRITRVLSQISILFRKQLKYRDDIKLQIIKMKNSGVVTALEEKYLAVKRDLPREQVYQEVTIYQVLGIVMAYLALVVISVIMLLLELVKYHKMSKNVSTQLSLQPATSINNVQRKF